MGELHAKSTENSFFARPGDASKFIAVLANFSSFEEERKSKNLSCSCNDQDYFEVVENFFSLDKKLRFLLC